MEKNSLNQNLHQIGGIGNLVVDNPEDVLRGAANFTGISGKAMLEEMSRSHSNLVAIGGSEGYTGAETSGGGYNPSEEEEGGNTGSGGGGDAGNDQARESGRRQGAGEDMDTMENSDGLGGDNDK